MLADHLREWLRPTLRGVLPLGMAKELEEAADALACVSGTCGDCRECLHKTIIQLEKDLADAKRFIKRYQDIV